MKETTVKLSEVIGRAIEMHRALPRERVTRPPGAKGGFIRASEIPPAGPPPPEKLALIAFLRAQPVAVITAVAVVMYLGRGDFAEDFEFADCYERMSHSDVRYLPQHLANKIPFADYLEKGLRRLREMELKVDELLEA